MNRLPKKTLLAAQGQPRPNPMRPWPSHHHCNRLLATTLQAPAKNLYPVSSPRSETYAAGRRRHGRPVTNWRQDPAPHWLSALTRGVGPEGQRSGQMSYSTSYKSASYWTIGRKTPRASRSISAGRQFEDIQARMTFRLLQKICAIDDIELITSQMEPDFSLLRLRSPGASESSLNWIAAPQARGALATVHSVSGGQFSEPWRLH